jgi:hypothetical protein
MPVVKRSRPSDESTTESEQYGNGTARQGAPSAEDQAYREFVTNHRVGEHPPSDDASGSSETGTKASRLEALRAKRASRASLVLASDYSEPETNPAKLGWLLYGEMKIGKTSLASVFPNAVFMMFEPGGKGLRIRKNDIQTWADFEEGYLPQILTSPYELIVVDTADRAYDMCFAHICRKKSVDHPNEGRFGDVWNAIESTFVGAFTKILASGRGVIFTSHAETKTFQKRTGGEYDKIVPSMSKAAREYMKAVVDVIGYYGYYGNDRYLTVAGNDELDAGHRMKYRFWVSGQYTETLDERGAPQYEGQRVSSIPMGNSEEEGYRNLLAAFNNEQTWDGRPERKAVLTDRPPKKR